MGKHSSGSSEEVSNESDASSSEEELLKAKKKSKRSKHSSLKKKKSKDKKHKKKSKKQRRRSSSSDASSSESEYEDEWVAADSTKPDSTTPNPEKVTDDDLTFKKPKLEPTAIATRAPIADNDEWTDFGTKLGTYSNDSKKSERRKQKEQERASRSIDQLGQQANELNPYWKEGGTGLPEENVKTNPVNATPIGDGGLSWLRKAFLRSKEQAEKEGRTLEDVVSERWGSLEKFMSLLEEAEKKAQASGDSRQNHGGRRRDNDKRFVRPRRDDSDDDSYGSSRHSSSSRSHRHERSRDRRRSRSRDRGSSSGWRKRTSPDKSVVSSSKSRKRSSSPKRRRRSPSPKQEIRIRSPVNTSKMQPIPLVSTIKSSSTQNRKSSSSEPETDIVEESPTIKILTDKEMNELNAKLMKAEMLGNTSLMEDLKIKIQDAENTRKEYIKNGGDVSKKTETKIVTKVLMDSGRDRGRRVKDKITETHKDGQRVRYFPDDDKYTLQNMFQKEKMNTAEDENALFARLAGKSSKTGLDYDADDIFTDKASSSKQVAKEREREIKDVLDKEKEYKKILDTCQWCFDSSASEKHIILSVAEKSYLCVPAYQSLTEGHCLIVPMSHASSSTELDEDVWAEMQKFRKTLVRMFKESDQDLVIFETAVFLKRHPHMFLECVPMPKETGELAPIYFKKAIQECETEWAHNKKVVDLRNRDVRRAVPKGLPYFSVDFGDDSCGFAHVIEDERNFPRNFAHEIIGGMLELDHHLWRKQKKDDFKTQRTKVMEFLKVWGPHDWTRD